MPDLYIIAGPNGAGKTTSAYVILPEILNCLEFVNADSIAAGLSPFNPESTAMYSGKLMLHRIDELLFKEKDFAFETTLASKTFLNLIKKAKAKNYKTHLFFLSLESPNLAKSRVQKRVSQGGHNISHEVVERRFSRGTKNLFELYMPIVDNCYIYDNSFEQPHLIAQKTNKLEIFEKELWQKLNQKK